MAYLFSLTFQGQVTTEASLSSAEESDVERLAFPSLPPRDAAILNDFRAFKTAPLEDGSRLVSVVAGGGRDRFNRPVLCATGCVLGATETSGALRDLGAVWEALEGFDVSRGFEAFKARVAMGSICAAPGAFQLFRTALERYGDFYAKLAAALSEEKVDLYLGAGGVRVDLIRPAFGLLSLPRLRRLHLALGAEDSEYREPVLGLAECAPPDLAPEKKGILGALLAGRKGPQQAVSADFQRREVFGAPSEGPRALAAAIADPRPWPDGLTGLDRYRVLLQCVDAPGSPPTPFDLRPKLEELRQAVDRLEVLAQELTRWR